MGKKLSIYRDSHTWPLDFVNFGPETTENGWRVFAPPAPKFLHLMPALPHGRYLTDSRQTLARVM